LRNVFPFLFFAALLSSCSFDYGETGSPGEGQPDIVMERVEYVRIREGSPQVRFQAEKAERFEDERLMELQNFSFEQYNRRGTEASTVGRIGSASVELESGNIRMEEGVRIEVDSEDIAIETSDLRWQDKERILSGGEESEVTVYRANGSRFSGWGFSANAREKTWSFTRGIEGVYIHEEEEEAGGEETDGEEPLEEGEEPLEDDYGEEFFDALP